MSGDPPVLLWRFGDNTKIASPAENGWQYRQHVGLLSAFIFPQSMTRTLSAPFCFAIRCLTIGLLITPHLPSAAFFHALGGTVPLQGMPRDESGVRSPSAGKFSGHRCSNLAAVRRNRHSVPGPWECFPGRSSLGAERQLCSEAFQNGHQSPDYPISCSIGITDFQNRIPATGKVRSIPTGTDIHEFHENWAAHKS
ncbi:MAG: hypothetical protein ACK5MO_00900 [Planctomyces sp.]